MTPYSSKTNKGAVVIMAVIMFIIISSAIIFAVVDPLTNQIHSSSYFIRNAQLYANEDYVNDEVLYKLNNSITLPSSFSFTQNNATSSVVITDFGQSKQIVSENSAEQINHTITSNVTATPTYLFPNAVEAGSGGLVLDGDASALGAIATTSSKLSLFSDSTINGWKKEASTTQIHEGDWSIGSNTTASTTGAIKIHGNLSVTGSSTLILNGNLYVTGNINVTNGGELQLGSSLGTYAGIIVVDGKVVANTGGAISGNGNAGSNPLVVSTNTASDAVTASSSIGNAILVAQNGGIYLSGGNTTPCVIGKSVHLGQGTVINYDSNIASLILNGGINAWWSLSGNLVL